jgi:hypothetical protein
MNVLVLTPSRGRVSTEQRDMLVRFAHKHRRDFPRSHLSFSDDTSSGMLAHSRAILLARLAHSPPGTRGLWLDSDTYLDEERILWALQRPEDIIVWNYPVRVAWDTEYPPIGRRADAELVRAQPFRMWTADPVMRDGWVSRSDDGQLVELRYAGFGAVVMSQRVAAQIHEENGPIRMSWAKVPVSEAFQPMPPPEPMHSEDISFWLRARSRGHRIWCDPVPYVTNGQSGGCFADEIRLREGAVEDLCRLAACGC